MAAWIMLALAVLLGIYIVAGGGSESISSLEVGEWVYIALVLALVSLYVLSLGFEYSGRWLKAARHALLYAGLFLVLMAGYTYRTEITDAATRVGHEFAPPGTAFELETGRPGERSVRLRKRTGNQFAARTEVNGVPVTMLVDTGASTVVLKPADAEKAGIDLARLAYTVPVDTANGTTFAAAVRVKSIAVGPIEVRDVEALVAKPGNLKESLLGMTFLKRLRSYEFSGDYLTLRG